MANKRSIANRIVAKIGGPLVVYRGYAYVPGFKTFLRGLLVEGTPYKDTVYIRNCVIPFYRETSPYLDYSPRIQVSPGSAQEYFRGSDEEIANQAVTAIHAFGLLPDLLHDTTPADFLSLHPLQQDPYAMPFVWLLDTTAAALLAGNLEVWRRGRAAATATLERIRRHESSIGQPADAYTRARAKLLDTMHLPLDQATSTLRQAIVDNATRHGFRPAPLDAHPTPP